MLRTAALLLAAFAGPGVVEAAKCGGDRECRCGDRVVEDYVLPNDLGPCPEIGLEIGGAVVLDGGGHTVQGRGRGVGIRLGREASGSRIRGLRVTGFARGIRLHDVRRVRLDDVETFRNGDLVKHEGYGIDFAQGASDNVVSRARVHDNADEGIHLGAHCRDNRIVDSEIWGNYRENVYFLANRGARLERSRLRSPGQGAANVYIKFSQDVVLEKNRIDGGTVQLRGASSGTRLIDNTLEGALVVLQSQRDRRFGEGRPVATTIQGGRIEDDGACIRAESTSTLAVTGTRLECRDAVTVADSSDVTLSDVANTRVRCDGPGTVRRLQPVEVRFVDAAGKPQPRVQLRTRSGRSLGEADAEGRYRGPVDSSRLSCPQGDWQPVREVEIVAEGREQTIAVEKLRGTVTLSSSGGAR